ncbi:hypothetical protein AB0L40_11610 [Patulibacter sp. NPDC049589]|uniref:sporulation protein n=1 Tax=Patulibacter sp. NPDC049589 TaxID=3154731 RepID=UPI003430822B
MGLLRRRGSSTTLRLHPAGPLRPTDTVTVTVALDEPVDRVEGARLELGYVNRYPYRWAGRRAVSSASLDHDLFSTVDVGTDYGSDRDTEEWVHVLDVPLPAAGGRLEAGTRDVQLRVPSWAPGSSDVMVRWMIRLHVERSGRDVTAEEELTVLVAPPDPAPEQPHERLEGQGAEVVVVPDRDWWRPGEELRGTVLITPTAPVSTGTLDVRIERLRISHPLVRTPGGTQVIERPSVRVAKGFTLRTGVETAIPFVIAVPEDAPPTTESVHASVAWFVRASVEYPGHASIWPDRVRRGFGVFTA